MISITVPGDPVPKGRPRVTTRGGFARTYTPKKTRDYEARIRAAAVEAMAGRPPTLAPVEVEIGAYFGVPKSWPDWKKRLFGFGESIGHAMRPDLDNVIKAALDALNGVAFADDAQVMDIRGIKYFNREPRLEIKCTIIPGDLEYLRRRRA